MNEIAWGVGISIHSTNRFDQMHTLSRKSMGKQVIRAVVYREKGMMYAIENGFCEGIGLIGEHGRDSLQTSGIEQVRV